MKIIGISLLVLFASGVIYFTIQFFKGADFRVLPTESLNSNMPKEEGGQTTEMLRYVGVKKPIMFSYNSNWEISRVDGYEPVLKRNLAGLENQAIIAFSDKILKTEVNQALDQELYGEDEDFVKFFGITDAAQLSTLTLGRTQSLSIQAGISGFYTPFSINIKDGVITGDVYYVYAPSGLLRVTSGFKSDTPIDINRKENTFRKEVIQIMSTVNALGL